MKHKKIINQIYNYIKNIEDFDYQHMITDPSLCLQDNKDFDEFFDSEHGDFLDFNVDLDTFNDLARFAILKKLQRDLQIKWCKEQLKEFQQTQEFQDQFKLAKENKKFVTISCEFLKKVNFSSSSVLSEATAPDLEIYELKNGNILFIKKLNKNLWK